jgi:hypothetical protein
MLSTVAWCGQSASAQTPAPGPVYVGPSLSPGFEIGANTGKGRDDWVKDMKGSMKCAYPTGQGWGTVFITAGVSDGDVAKRLTVDESHYKFLSVDVKGAHGGETINVGVKTKADPDNGQEPTYTIDKLTTDWQTFKIPLSKLVKAPAYPATRFKHLYVACEIVFSEEAAAETISFKNVAFTN